MGASAMTEILINAELVDFVEIMLSPVSYEVEWELREMEENKEYDDVNVLIENSGLGDFLDRLPNENRIEFDRHLSTKFLIEKSRYLELLKHCPRHQGWR